MTHAIAVVDDDTQLVLPVVYVSEPDRARMTVPLLLVVGWAILFAFIVSFMMDDDGGAVPSPEMVAGSEAPVETVRAAAQTVQQVAAEPLEMRPAAPPTSEPLPTETEAVEQPSERVAALPDPSEAAPMRRADATGLERPGFVGVWGPDIRACGARARRRGFLPATITESGAKAGSTACRFRHPRRDGPGWVTTADCSDGDQRWTSQVRMVVSGNTLNWTSAKGPARYVRCGRRQG